MTVATNHPSLHWANDISVIAWPTDDGREMELWQNAKDQDLTTHGDWSFQYRFVDWAAESGRAPWYDQEQAHRVLNMACHLVLVWCRGHSFGTYLFIIQLAHELVKDYATAKTFLDKLAISRYQRVIDERHAGMGKWEEE